MLFHYIQKIEASAIEDFYGLASDLQKTSESGYILFYQSREWHSMEEELRSNMELLSSLKMYNKILKIFLIL